MLIHTFLLAINGATFLAAVATTGVSAREPKCIEKRETFVIFSCRLWPRLIITRVKFLYRKSQG